MRSGGHSWGSLTDVDQLWPLVPLGWGSTGRVGSGLKGSITDSSGSG